MTPYGAPEKLFKRWLNTDTYTCLLWPYAVNNKGYGVMRFKGKAVTVHRRMCTEANGPPPTDRHEAAHTCGRGRNGCANKRHLTWKTTADNELDKLQHGTHNRGTRHGMSKLTEQEVTEIRALLRTPITQREIGARYGVTRKCINHIHLGKSWGWLTDEGDDK